MLSLATTTKGRVKMNSIDTLAAFFGWCTIVSVGVYAVTVVSLLLFRDRALRINARLFGITEKEVAVMSFQYVGNFKLATTMLCFVPYVALRIIG